jgi:hypothetical protein
LVTEIEISRSATAFKHPRCGGLVLLVREPDRVYFQCDTCLSVADELEKLAVGRPVILRKGKRREPDQSAGAQGPGAITADQQYPTPAEAAIENAAENG